MAADPVQHWAKDWHTQMFACGAPFLLPGLRVIVTDRIGLSAPLIEREITCLECRRAAWRCLRGP